MITTILKFYDLRNPHIHIYSQYFIILEQQRWELLHYIDTMNKKDKA